MVMVLDDWMFYGFAGVSLLCLFAGIAIFAILKNNAPDAFVHWKANRTGDAVCRVHFRGRKCQDYIAEIDKSEKGLNSNMWTVPGLGIKFTPGPEDIEFIEGSIPCVNYFEKLPTGIKTNEVVALSQLKDYLNKIGLPVDGNERNILYTLQDMQKGTAKNAIKNARVESAETKSYLMKYLNAVEQKKAYLEKLTVESGVFTYQTAMKALDDAIAHTSAEVAHAKEVIRAAAKREEDHKNRDLMQYCMIAFIVVIIGIMLLYGLQGLK